MVALTGFTLVPVHKLGELFEPADPVEPTSYTEWVTVKTGDGLDYPPGVAGHIARFIFGSAPRPVMEVAIVASLGWLAGVCGRAFQFEDDGPNLYLLLLALSGIGKEHMHGGVHILMEALTRDPTDELRHARRFVDASELVSGPALAKACADNPSFVLLASEFGRTLKLLSKGKDSNVATFATQLTKLYSKSGTGAVAGGMKYSNRENNVESVQRIALSLIGESTPDTFYEAVDSDMLEDGFMSRFTVVEFSGKRPARNKSRLLVPKPELVKHLRGLLLQAITLNSRNERQQVQCTEQAYELLDKFDVECDAQINANPPNYKRQMLNRAHLKVQRVSTLLAVADNHIFPVINLRHVEWALELVRRDMKMQTAKHESGEVGKNDDARERKLVKWIKEFIVKAPTGYGIPDNMHDDKVIPRKYFQQRAQSAPAFFKHQLGTIRALDDAIRSMCDSGYLLEMEKMKAAESYGFQGRCYRFVTLPGFD